MPSLVWAFTCDPLPVMLLCLLSFVAQLTTSGKSYPSPTTNGGRSCDIFGIREHRKNPHLKLMTRKVSLSPQRRCVLIAEDRGPKQESERGGFESLLPRVSLGHNCLIQSNFFMLVLFLHQTLLKIYMGCLFPWVFISL